MITQGCRQVDIPLAKGPKQAWREYTAAHADKTQPIKGRRERKKAVVSSIL